MVIDCAGSLLNDGGRSALATYRDQLAQLRRCIERWQREPEIDVIFLAGDLNSLGDAAFQPSFCYPTFCHRTFCHPQSQATPVCPLLSAFLIAWMAMLMAQA